MGEPQQPELARSRRSAASDSAAKAKATTSTPATRGSKGPIPEDNLPGHHPEVEQDKPTGPPKPRRSQKSPARSAAEPADPKRYHRSRLRREQPFATASRVFGVTEDNSYVVVEGDALEIRFGPWQLTTTLDNVESAEVTGPFQWWKVIGPAHLSLKDRGITFATSAGKALCIRFRQPVPALDPRGVVRHPGATVTVEDPEDLARFIANAKNAA